MITNLLKIRTNHNNGLLLSLLWSGYSVQFLSSIKMNLQIGNKFATDSYNLPLKYQLQTDPHPPQIMIVFITIGGVNNTFRITIPLKKFSTLKLVITFIYLL